MLVQTAWFTLRRCNTVSFIQSPSSCSVSRCFQTPTSSLRLSCFCLRTTFFLYVSLFLKSCPDFSSSSLTTSCLCLLLPALCLRLRLELGSYTTGYRQNSVEGALSSKNVTLEMTFNNGHCYWYFGIRFNID